MSPLPGVLPRVIYLYLVLTIYQDIVSAVGMCDGGWLEFQGHCYGIYTNEPDPGSLNNAIRFCSARGAHVVSITSPEENAFVANALESSKPSSRCFIGVQDYWTEGTFHTLEQEPLAYLNFRGGEPDNGGDTVTERENCAFLFSTSGLWSDQICTNNVRVKAYVCEKDPKYRSVQGLVIDDGKRLDKTECQLESHTVNSLVECGVKYLQSQVALSFNVARNMTGSSPNCYLMTCTPIDVISVRGDPDWILHYVPAIY